MAVLQIETRNPHFHDNKGEDTSRACGCRRSTCSTTREVTLPAVRQAIVDFMVAQGALEPGQEPPRERIYPPVGTLALDLLYDALDAEAQSFRQLDGRAAAGLPAAPPIDRDKIPV